MTDILLPVILCGGSGSRLWPLSREDYPKQFLALAGEQTMLQRTATRLGGLSTTIDQARAPLLVCNDEHRFLAAGQLMEIGMTQPSIILEPVARNTAPALTIAALHACADGADPVLLVMPADHIIENLPVFHQAVQNAYAAARKGHVVTFGVLPDRPETGFGYIQYGQEREAGARSVERFVEKPDAGRAEHYLSTGGYLWNSGLFMLRASTWLQALGRCRPDILEACQAAMRSARHDMDFIRPDAGAFTSCPADSIDYAVMERLPGHPEWGFSTLVVPMQAAWSDVGAWDAVWGLSERDARGNALVGTAVVQEGCTDCLLFSSERLVAGVGLDGLIVVESPDAVLVVNKRRTQDVKKIVAQLTERGLALAHSHRKVHRPWGWYDSVDRGGRFQVKRIQVNPGASLSLQMHRHRAEHWVVVKGVAEVTRGDQIFLLNEDESTYIPLGTIHRLKNPGDEPLEIIEIQSGSYLGEDDIVRFEDVYGRTSENN